MLKFLSASSATLSLGDSLVNWYERSVIKELLDYFGEKYFSVQLGTFENFSVAPSLGITLRNIILALALGIIIAVCTTAYTRVNIGGFVRKLIAEGCLSEASAKNLSELGYFHSTGVRRALKKSTSLGMVVRRAGDSTPTADASQNDGEMLVNEQADTADFAMENDEDKLESNKTPAENATHVAKQGEKIDFLTAKFYVPEDLRTRAEIRFNPKGSNWKSAILVSVITVVVAGALCVLAPELVQLADNIMSWLAP